MITYGADFSETCREKINDHGANYITIGRFITDDNTAYFVNWILEFKIHYI